MDLTLNLALAALPLGVCALFAWAIWKYADEYADWSKAARGSFAGGLLFLGLVASAGITYSAITLDRTLVDHIDLETPGEGPHRHDFDIRTAGQEHRLHLIPKGKTRMANGPVKVKVELQDGANQPLLSEEHLFEVRQAAGPDHLSSTPYWDEVTMRFTPRSAGPHKILLRVLEGSAPKVGILVNESP